MAKRKKVERKPQAPKAPKLTPAKMAETSVRLRHSIEIGNLCGFEYAIAVQNRYGGFFNVIQLESVEKTLRGQLLEIAELKAEIGRKEQQITMVKDLRRKMQ